MIELQINCFFLGKIDRYSLSDCKPWSNLFAFPLCRCGRTPRRGCRRWRRRRSGRWGGSFIYDVHNFVILTPLLFPNSALILGCASACRERFFGKYSMSTELCFGSRYIGRLAGHEASSKSIHTKALPTSRSATQYSLYLLHYCPMPRKFWFCTFNMRYLAMDCFLWSKIWVIGRPRLTSQKFSCRPLIRKKTKKWCCAAVLTLSKWTLSSNEATWFSVPRICTSAVTHTCRRPQVSQRVSVLVISEIQMPMLGWQQFSRALSSFDPYKTHPLSLLSF